MTPTRQQYRQGARDGSLSALAYDAETERINQRMREHEVASFAALKAVCEKKGIPTTRANNVYDLQVLVGVRRDLDRLSELLWGDHDDEMHAAMAS